jgi:hypothetical protein
MSLVPPASYTRRPLPDGTTVSFCNQCFGTVAESHWEAELDKAEQDHVCDPLLLEYWKRLSDAIRSNKPDTTP